MPKFQQRHGHSRQPSRASVKTSYPVTNFYARCEKQDWNINTAMARFTTHSQAISKRHHDVKYC